MKTSIVLRRKNWSSCNAPSNEGVAREDVSDEVAEIVRAQLGWLEKDIANEIVAYEMDCGRVL